MKGSRVEISNGQTGTVQSTWRDGEDYLACVLLDGTNREIEVYVSELRHYNGSEVIHSETS